MLFSSSASLTQMLWLTTIALSMMSSQQTAAATSSVWDVLSENEEFLLFRQGLESANLEHLLELKADQNDDNVVDSTYDYNGKEDEWTIFAPSNDAFADPPDLMARYFLYNQNPIHWKEHLKELLLHQMVNLDAFTLTSLFRLRLAGGALRTAAGEIVTIDPERERIGGQRIVPPNDLVAANGVVHALPGFFEDTNSSTGQRQKRQIQTLLDIIQAGVTVNDNENEDNESFATLLSLLNQTSLLSAPELSQNLYAENGTTFLAPRDSAFLQAIPVEFELGDDTIAMEKDLLLYGDDNEMKEDVLLYHVLDGNLFWDGSTRRLVCEDTTRFLYRGCFVKTKHPTGAHVLVSESKEEGVLLFNGIAGGQRQLGSNGILYVVNEVLEPPRIMELFGKSLAISDYHDFPIIDLMVEDGWNVPNLTSVFHKFERWEAADSKTNPQQQQRYTIFMPPVRDYERIARLKTPEWSLHRQDLLRNLVYQGTFTETELLEMAGDDTAHLQMLGGMNRTIETYRNSVSISDVNLFGDEYFTIHGVDGDLRVIPRGARGVSSMLPPSYTQDLRSLTTYEWKDLIGRYQQHFLPNKDEISISPLHRDPVTFLCPPFEDAESLLDKYYDGTSAHLLHNHFFDGLFYMDQLLEMDGQSMTSINGQNWIISVLDKNVFLQLETIGEASSKTNQSLSAVMIRRDPHNILGRNGVIHYLDSPLIDSSPPTADDVQVSCADQLRSYNDCYENCNSDYCNPDTSYVKPDAYIGYMVPAMQLSKKPLTCDVLSEIVCDRPFDRSTTHANTCCLDICVDKAQDVLVCYGKEFMEEDLSDCSATVCPTPTPTSSPTPRPTSRGQSPNRAPVGGDTGSTDDSFFSGTTDVLIFVGCIFGLFVAVLAFLVGRKCSKERAPKRRLLADADTESSQGGHDASMTVVFIDDEEVRVT